MRHRLVEDGGVVLCTVVCLHLSGDVTRLERAVLPGDLLAVLVTRPDLFTGRVEGPLGVAVLLGDVLTDRHHLHLGQDVRDGVWLAVDGIEVTDVQTVVPGPDCGPLVLALSVGHHLALVNWHLLANLLRPLQTLSLELVVTDLLGGLVEGELRIARDVDTVLALLLLLGGLDSEEREERD